MLNFYRRFLPHAAGNQTLLNDYLKGSKKNDKRVIDWTEETSKAFVDSKQQLVEATLLVHPIPEARLAIMVDASDLALGAVVQQRVSDTWQPLGFYSVKLNETQQRYSAYDRELLAAYSAIKHFRHLVEGRPFTLFTDHKPLIFAFKQNPAKASPRQFRHLDFIGQFTTDIQHVSGMDNVVADTLSRIEEITIPATIDYEKIAEAQHNDAELKELMESKGQLKFQAIPLPGSNNNIICETSTGINRPYIPDAFRKTVFESIHNLAHPGISTTAKMVAKKFIWTAINRDARKLAQNCLECQKSKVTRHTQSVLGNFPLVSQRFTEIHIDIVGPLPSSDGHRYCLTMIDRYTRWPEAVAIADIRAETVALALLTGWIARFGVPESIVTDQGSQFESELFAELSKLLGFERKRTTSYNPKANGFIERWHRTLKAAIMSHNKLNWTRSLPTVLLGLRTVFREDFGTTSAELVYGTTIRIPGQLVEDKPALTLQSDFVLSLRDHFKELRPHPPTRHISEQNGFVFKTLNTCSHVLLRTDAVRKSLQPPYEGPYPVVERYEKNFIIDVRGKQCRVSIDRLKPCFVESSDSISHQSGTAQDKRSSNIDNATSFGRSLGETEVETVEPPKKTFAKVTFNPNCAYAQDSRETVDNHIPGSSTGENPLVTRSGRVTRPPARLLDSLTWTGSLVGEYCGRRACVRQHGKRAYIGQHDTKNIDMCSFE